MLEQSMSCPGRFLRPFEAALAQYPGLECEVKLAHSQSMKPRIAVELVHHLILRWVRVTRDADFGLHAGRSSCLGLGGALDFAVRTAPTLRDSVQLAQRYASLYSDELGLSVVRSEDRVSIQIGSQLSAPRALTDFILSAWYRNHLQPHLDAEAMLECCFRYPEPVLVGVHQSVFGSAKLRFDATFDGFSFDCRRFERALASADASLHDSHCEYLELLASSQLESLATRVRWLLEEALRNGPLTSSGVARRLRISRRTLVRRLAREGTSFSLLLDDLRREIGMRLMHEDESSFQEITRSLGLSHVQTFYRSFKRWTGLTPRDYREEMERGPAATRAADRLM